MGNPTNNVGVGVDFDPPKKVVFCIPTYTKPFAECLEALGKSIPLIEEAGWLHDTVVEVGCPYISHARSVMLHKALRLGATVIVFIDHDLSWEPEDLLTLADADGDVVAGTYRFKRDSVDFMGALMPDVNGLPQERSDGGLRAHSVPAGFLKITTKCVNQIIREYPELCYLDEYFPHVDLFNHGAYKNAWWGEDYAFSRRWLEAGGDIVILPHLQLVHHSLDGESYNGTYADYLMSLPGGSNHKD